METVAAARRELPPGGVVPEDYVFQAAGADGTSTDVRLSELFAPGKDSLVIYSFMFPCQPWPRPIGPAAVRRRCCWSRRVPAVVRGPSRSARRRRGARGAARQPRGVAKAPLRRVLVLFSLDQRTRLGGRVHRVTIGPSSHRRHEGSCR
ncbi:MAG: DUF899 family protein [Thermoleophilaceae bacterium]|nr:DUF899 family protein [Thermoleophilaceae bacterium]